MLLQDCKWLVCNRLNRLSRPGTPGRHGFVHAGSQTNLDVYAPRFSQFWGIV